MQQENLLIDPERLRFVASEAWQPLGLVNLDACADTTRIEALPPFPLLGLGNAGHALALRLDAVLEAPFMLDALVKSVTHHPHAAGVAVQLLRSTEGMSLTNLAFGGPDRRTLYCTESMSGSVLRATLDVPGMPLHAARGIKA